MNKKHTLKLAALAVGCVILMGVLSPYASAGIKPPSKEVDIPGLLKEENKIRVSMKCEPVRGDGVQVCIEKFHDGTKQMWWLKTQADGITYKYNQYPSRGVKPVPFR